MTAETAKEVIAGLVGGGYSATVQLDAASGEWSVVAWTPTAPADCGAIQAFASKYAVKAETGSVTFS